MKFPDFPSFSIIPPKPEKLLIAFPIAENEPPKFFIAFPTSINAGPDAAKLAITLAIACAWLSGILSNALLNLSKNDVTFSRPLEIQSPTNPNFSPTFSNVSPNLEIALFNLSMFSCPPATSGSKCNNRKENVLKLVFKLSRVPVNVPSFNFFAIPTTEYWNISLASSVVSRASVRISKLSLAGNNPSDAIFLTSSFVVL